MVNHLSVGVDHRRKVRFEDYLRFETVRPWYEAHRSKKTMIYRLASYVDWRRQNGLSTDPDSWVRECLNGTNLTLIEHARALESWVNSEDMRKKQVETRHRYSTDIKGLYLHHHIRMPRLNFARGVEDSSVQFEVTATEYLEMARKVLTHAGIPLRDRSIIMSIIQSAMDESTLSKVFNYVTFPQLAKHFGTEDFTRWDESKTPVKVDLVRPKTNYRYYTFLGHDAVMLLREYLVSRRATFGEIKIHGSTHPKALPRSDPLYLNKYGQPISAGYVGMIFREAGKLAGVNVPPTLKLAKYQGATIRYPFHAHQARDTLITLRQRAHVDRAVVDFFAGHKFDDDNYDSPWDNPDLFRDEYVKVSKYLNIITGEKALLKEEYDRRLESELSTRDQQLRELVEWKKTMEAMLADPKGRGLVGAGAEVDFPVFKLTKEEIEEVRRSPLRTVREEEENMQPRRSAPG